MVYIVRVEREEGGEGSRMYRKEIVNFPNK